MTRVQAVAIGWVALIVAIVLLNVFFPQPFGAAALGAILEPYLVLTGLVGGVIALRAPRVVGRGLVIALLVIAVPRYLPSWVSLPSTPSGDTLRVATWNVHAGRNTAARALSGVASSDAQLFAVEEIGMETASALARADTRFEHTAFGSATDFPDVGLLSEFPILETEHSRHPPFLRAVVDPPTAESIVVYVLHSPLGRYVTWAGVPVAVDLTVRDASIAVIRERLEADLATHRSVIVLGDFNTTEREPAYAHVSRGLRDAHLDAGVGPGLTWRPSPLQAIPFGVLRIDYVLSTPDLVPTSSTVDCTLPSDHCRVDVELAMTRTSAQAVMGTGTSTR